MSDKITTNPGELTQDLKALEKAISATTESLRLFGVESKSLVEIESKIKSVTEIAGGLQIAFKTLGKTGGWITIIATGITGLISRYNELNKTIDHVKESRQSLEAIELASINATAGQQAVIGSWISIANDYTKPLELREKAIRKLNEIMPSYNGNIDKEGKLTADADKALHTYLNTLQKTTQAKLLYDKISNVNIKINEKINQHDTSVSWGEEAWAVISAPFKGKKSFEVRQELINAKRDANRKEIEALRKEETEYKNKIAELFQDDSVVDIMSGNAQLSNKEKNDKTDNRPAVKPINLNQTGAEKLATEKKINDEIRALIASNNADRIELMDEGTKKTLTKIEYDYNQLIATIRQREQEWRDAQGGILTEEQQTIGKEERLNATNKRINEEEAVINKLTDKYKSYSDQRKEIEAQYNRDLQDLRMLREKAVEDENDARVRETDEMINNLIAKQGKDLMVFDFNTLKENGDFSWAFENIKNTSTETLNVLLDRLNAINDSDAQIDSTKLKEYSETIQKIIDEFTTRNPVAALAGAQNRLTQANMQLAKSKQELDAANASGDEKAKTQAELNYTAALIEREKANQDIEKSQAAVNEKMGELFKNLSGVGTAISGQAGQIISLIGDIGSFVTTSISGVQKAAKAGVGALAALEKASAILAIIQLAIQLAGKIGNMISDTHQQYEKFAKKLAEINKLRDAVNDYQLAVLKAKQAEESWFGKDRLQSLKNAKVVNNKVKENYDEKVNEEQAKYVDKKGGGWLTKTVKWFGDAYSNTAGKFYDNTVGKVSETIFGDLGKKLADIGEAASFGIGTQASLGKYNKDTVKAYENLRIETRARKKGFLGSGIGGKSQKTQDLRSWARDNGFGELFDEENMINKDVAQQIIDTKGDKLVGETKETLERLIELSEQYDEYQKQLRDYVAKLYEPLVNNFVDSIWAWFDKGKDALTSFKEMAGKTFRDIVSDMIRTIVLEKIVGSYSDDVVEMYNEYAEGKLTEEQLMDKVAQRTDEMIGTYEEQIPTLQNLMTNLAETLNESGIDITQKEEEKKTQTAEKGSFQTMSQETGSELLGQFTAIRIHTSNIHDLVRGMENEHKLINTSLTAIEKNTYNTVDELKQVNGQLKQLKVEGIKVL